MGSRALTAPQEQSSFTINQFRQRNGGLSRGAVYSEIAKGHLRTIKVGRRRLITAEQEAAWHRLCEAES